jgi:hypothetical protein
MSTNVNLTVTFNLGGSGYLEADLFRLVDGSQDSDRINLVKGIQDKNTITFTNVSAYDKIAISGFTTGNVDVAIDRTTHPLLLGNYSAAFNDSVGIR